MDISRHEPKQRKTKPQPAAVPEPAKASGPRTGGASDYGQYYWCVKTELSGSGEIYVFADEVRHLPTGGVLFVSKRADGCEINNLALAAGQWAALFAASCFDGHAVAVEHWEGEIIR